MEDYKKLADRTLNDLRRSEKYCLNDYSRMAGNAANLIEILLDKLKCAEGERDAVTRHMIELEQEVGRLRAERDALAERNRSAYEIAWGCDIPSPTVPEYVELHRGMTRVMEALKGQKKEA